MLAFVASALLPVGVLAAVVLTKGSTRLREEGLRQLRHACKARAMAAYERLQLLDAEMRMANARGDARVGGSTGHGQNSRSVALARIRVGQSTHAMFGPDESPPALSEEQWAHLGADKPLLVVDPVESQRAGTFLVRAMDPANPRDGTLWARVSVDDLLDFETLIYARRLTVLDAHGRPMHSSVAAPVAMTDAARPLAARSSRGVFEWAEGDDAFLGSYWKLFLKGEFGAPSWTMVLSESRRSMNAPILAFEQALVLSIILSVAIISLLSIVLIRRTLGPIAVLLAGTRKLTAQDFDHRVRVRGGDEFEELAHSFNTMAEHTGHHLRALETMGDVQRAILSTLKASEIVDSFLARVPELLDCVSAGVILMRSTDGAVESYVRVEGAAPLRSAGRLSSALIESLGPDVESRVLDGPQSDFSVLAGLATTGSDKLVLLPIHIDGRLEAIVAAGCERGVHPAEDDIARLRALSGQMAVALANARVVLELEKLNWGTLSALARAIDAKSPWTQGHSERVTDLACRMGTVLGMGEDEMQTMRRGALLHDVGKIGSPAALLEKSGPLTDEEFEIMKAHVRLGARIVEPIAAFADALPIVLEHHERLDGSGYPAGLKGEAISYGARIVAVADCFDAIRSDRPYRKGLPIPEVLDIIRAGAGKTLDEDAVAALIHVVTHQPDVLTEQPRSAAFVIDTVGAKQ